MQNWLNKYYNILEIDSSYNFDKTKQSYKELSFIWHPDRQPEKFKKRAEEKIQLLNEAFSYFKKHREYLNNTSDKWEVDYGYEESDQYQSKIIECNRCNSSGFVAGAVANSLKFKHVDCPVCFGNAYLIVDDRNICQCCDGKGINSNISNDDREAYIQTHLKKLNIIEKIHSKLYYKKLWLKFHINKLLCKSCSGSGYFYYRSNKRKDNKDRRIPTEADFLFSLEKSNKRNQERRKPAEDKCA